MKNVTKENCLATLNPDLAKEWDSSKNTITPFEITNGSAKKAHWLCQKGHKWEAVVNSRSGNGNGCPYCSGLYASVDNCLMAVYPEIAKQWDYGKNEGSPSTVTPRSSKRIWWKCDKNRSWKNTIAHRTIDKEGCPYCLFLKVSTDNCLSATHPHVLIEWDYEKNGLLSPTKLTHKNSKIKIWWRCCNNHSWQASCNSRITRKSSCSYCSGRKPSSDHNLKVDHPELISEWHPTKNGNVKMEDIVSGSEKLCWWICQKGHSWEAMAYGRAIERHGCPDCSKVRVHQENCLSRLEPGLVKEWDFEKNTIKPDQITSRTNKKVWWICTTKKHSWRASISGRSCSGAGCPICAKKKVVLDDGEVCDSYIEAYVYLQYRLVKRFGLVHGGRYGRKLGRKTYDFYIPALNRFVEVTGYNKNWKHWIRYLRRIVQKKRYALSVGASFEFIQGQMDAKKRKFVSQHISR